MSAIETPTSYLAEKSLQGGYTSDSHNDATLLLADDDPLLLDALTSHVQSWGFDVKSCTDGKAALKALEGEKPRILLLDWAMPEVTGLEVCRAARCSPRSRQMYVILMSGRGLSTSAMQAIQAGADDFLAKPFEIAELKARVEKARRVLATRELSEAERRFKNETELFFNSVPSVLIALDANGCIARWNATAHGVFGLSEAQVRGKGVAECGIKWLSTDIDRHIEQWLAVDEVAQYSDLNFEREGKKRFLGLKIHRVTNTDRSTAGFLLTGADITERRLMEEQLRQAHKLEAIGQLAAGIAHEINTPSQYVGDNITFLQESWPHAARLLRLSQQIVRESAGGSVNKELLDDFEQFSNESEIEYLLDEIPKAIDQSLEGVVRVTKIVSAMKEFSHPGAQGKALLDINRAIETTVTIARNEWKYVAEVVTDFEPELPLVPCFASEFNQAILNLVVNAAHAISDVVDGGAKGKGKITVTTRRANDAVAISIQDTGCGIPEEIHSRVFEPFFTTKQAGKGTGQGLALAHAVIVKKHCGRIWFETEVGKGTTFQIRLPLSCEEQNEASRHTRR